MIGTTTADLWATHTPTPKPRKRRDTQTVEMWDGPAWIEVRNRLVVEHLPWARQIARKVASRLPTWFSADDLIGNAEIALLKLSDDYRSYQGTPFKSFARLRIEGACIDAARRREYRERALESLNAPLQCRRMDDERVEKIDRLKDKGPSPERATELAELREIWRYTERLPERHGIVIRLIYGEQMTGAEVARQLKLSEPRISGLHREALAMLREMVNR